MELDLTTIEAIMKLMGTHKIDRLKIQDLELVKSRHEAPKAELTSMPNLPSLPEEDLLYWSTSAPALTAEQVAALSANPPPGPVKTKRKG